MRRVTRVLVVAAVIGAVVLHTLGAAAVPVVAAAAAVTVVIRMDAHRRRRYREQELEFARYVQDCLTDEALAAALRSWSRGRRPDGS